MSHGLLRAVRGQGHAVAEFNTPAHIQYHSAAMGDELCDEHPEALALQMSNDIVIEVLRRKPELVVILNAHSTHPNSIAMIRELGVPIAVVFTESPYEDDFQRDFAAFCDVVFTNERVSAQREGWFYLPHAYDPEIHKPGAVPDESLRSDVLMIASGWKERQQLLEAIDWSGIDFKLRGIFVELKEDSPIWPHYRFMMLDNPLIPGAYAAAKIVFNHHRGHPAAQSINPRAVEAAACGAFFITDERAEGREIFRDIVPVYHDAREAEALIRHYLDRPQEREERAEAARQRIQGQTFAARACELMTVINQAIPSSRREA